MLAGSVCTARTQCSGSQAESLPTPDASGPETVSSASAQKQPRDKGLMHYVPLGILSFVEGYVGPETKQPET